MSSVAHSTKRIEVFFLFEKGPFNPLVFEKPRIFYFKMEHMQYGRLI